MRVVVVTGVSGAGKTTALHALEDLGYYCADNLPLPLLSKFVELLAARDEITRAALVADARSGEFLEHAGAVFAGLRSEGHRVDVLFLDAPDEVLIRRFSETRRRHPLAETDVREGLRAERARLNELYLERTALIDTGALNVHKLRGLIFDEFSGGGGRLAVSLLSFGFKYGAPPEADIMLDVRFFPNPYFVPELSPHTGLDAPVRDFVLEREETKTYLDRAESLLALSLRGFAREGKSYATVAIGCTGGRHRSVAVAEALADRLRAGGLDDVGEIVTRHRDVAR